MMYAQTAHTHKLKIHIHAHKQHIC